MDKYDFDGVAIYISDSLPYFCWSVHTERNGATLATGTCTGYRLAKDRAEAVASAISAQARRERARVEGRELVRSLLGSVPTLTCPAIQQAMIVSVYACRAVPGSYTHRTGPAPDSPGFILSLIPSDIKKPMMVWTYSYYSEAVGRRERTVVNLRLVDQRTDETLVQGTRTFSDKPLSEQIEVTE